MRTFRGFLPVRNNFKWILIAVIFVVAVLSILAMTNGIVTKSLHLDEGFFVRNLSYFPDGLFIGSAPSAPLFYYGTYGMTLLFGNAEWVYRIIPILCALISVIVFVRYLWMHCHPILATASILLFLTSIPVIHYAGFAHPYITDMMWAVVLMIFTQILFSDFSLRNWLLWLLWAVLSVASSYTALFVVTAYGILLFMRALILKRNREFKMILAGLIPCGIFSLAMIYFVFMKQANAIETFFMGNHPDWFIQSWNPVHVFEFVYKNTVGICEYLFFGHLGGIAGVFLMVLGTGWLLSKKDVWYWLIFAGPVLVTIGVSFFKKWLYIPERMMLFALPFFLVLMTEGMDFIWYHAKRNLLKIFAAASLAVLLVPQSYILKSGLKPVQDSDVAVRSLFNEMVPEVKDSDGFIVYFAAGVLFRYYMPDYLNHAVLQEWADRGHPEKLRTFVHKNIMEADGRYWLIFANVKEDEDTIMLEAAKEKSMLVKKLKKSGCQAYLFDHPKPDKKFNETQ